jgi:hypothetical protein
MFHGLFGQRHQSAADAGIGPDRVEPAIGRYRLGDEGDDVLFRAGIGRHGLRGAAGLAHQVNGFLDGFGAVDRDQFGALFGEQQRRRAADTAARAGDDDGFAFEAAHEFLPDRLCVPALAARWNFKQDFKHPNDVNTRQRY